MGNSLSLKPSELELNNGRAISFLADGTPPTMEDMRFQAARIVQISIGEDVGAYSQAVWKIVSQFSDEDLRELNP
jgi:hypothetical protein